jgi:uncharacterized membrane protein YkvA (DUF1232 family)
MAKYEEIKEVFKGIFSLEGLFGLVFASATLGYLVSVIPVGIPNSIPVVGYMDEVLLGLALYEVGKFIGDKILGFAMKKKK